VWLRATADGESDSGRFLDAGESRTITAQRDVALRAGDAGALTVAVNNGPREPLGRDGESITRRFAAADRSGAHAAGEAAAPAPAQPVATAGTQAKAGAEPPDLAVRVDQWLDAYGRRDSAAIAALSIHDASISDNRRPEERGPAGAAKRSIEGLRVQLAGDQAVLSGKLVETEASGRAARRSSWISQMWTRQNGVWLLMDARIRAESRPE
jgi:hypothetical protein